MALQGILPRQLYLNFLCLSISITFLLSPSLCSQYCDYAEELLVVFVQNFARFYGEDELVYNVHSLIHLVQDARKFGSLDYVSCFPYENFLGDLKNMVRRPQNPVAQIVRRIAERQKHVESSANPFAKVRCTPHGKPHLSGPLPQDLSQCRQFKNFHGEKYYVSCALGNNCFKIGNDIVLIKNILLSQTDETYIVYNLFLDNESFFKKPLDSLCLDIRMVSTLSNNLLVCSVSDLSHKCVLLPYADKYVAFPMLHLS